MNDNKQSNENHLYETIGLFFVTLFLICLISGFIVSLIMIWTTIWSFFTKILLTLTAIGFVSVFCANIFLQ